MTQKNDISKKNFYHPNNESKDIEKLLSKFFRNWKWILISLFLFCGTGFIYNRYTVPEYLIKSIMVIEEEKVSSPLSGGQTGITGDVFQGLGIMNSMRDIYTQIVILKSTPLISRALDELNYDISYSEIGRVTSSDIYKDSPFRVLWDRNHPQIVETDFKLDIHPDGTMELSIDDDNAQVYDYVKLENITTLPVTISETIEADSQIISDNYSFQILMTGQIDSQEIRNYKFRFHTPENLIKEYKEQLEIILPIDQTSVIELTLRENNIKKGVDFLNKLTEVYQYDNLDKTNENANRTIQFISSQLQSISDSLNISENRLETFQSQNQVLDISVQSQQLLEQMNKLDNERVELETKNKYYHYLKDYIEGNQDLETVIAPSAMGIEDPLLNNLILQLNELLTLKLSQTSIREGSEHPTILRLNAQIESAKKALLESITNIISQSDIVLEELNSRMSVYESQVRRLPGTERNFINIERTYKLNNETYTFLLQKLSEAQIAKASNVPNSMVIEAAHLDIQVKPQTVRIFSVALLLGIIFPAIIIFLRDFFSTKIESQQEIEAMTDYPIIGHIYHSKKENGNRTLVLDRPNTPFSETYRAIRNKLNMMCKGKVKPVIAVTSAFPNEGKTYNAINIASSFALIRKKTVVLDLDLRNSKMAEEFNLKSKSGVVNYIIGEKELKDITFETKHPFLKIIPAGPNPPNPAEMLVDEKVINLIANLKEIYDVVIVDTPPIGLVADLFQLHEYIDINLFIVRHRYTHKLGLKTALEEVEKNGLNGVGIIVNYVRAGKHANGYGYRYGYVYGYGSVYGYGNGKEQKKEKIVEEQFALKNFLTNNK